MKYWPFLRAQIDFIFVFFLVKHKKLSLSGKARAPSARSDARLRLGGRRPPWAGAGHQLIQLAQTMTPPLDVEVYWLLEALICAHIIIR